MKLNHVANRLDSRFFETVIEMLKVKLGFVELRRTERSIWLRQPGTNVDLQFGRSDTTARDQGRLTLNPLMVLLALRRVKLEGPLSQAREKAFLRGLNWVLSMQSSDGGWNDSYGGVFVALSVLSMELPFRNLPMFQDGGAGAR